MEKDNLSKSIFFILLLSLFISLFYLGYKKITDYEIFTPDKKVFVDIDKIIIPNEKQISEIDISEKDIQTDKINYPKLISEKNFTYKPKGIPVHKLNKLSTESLQELKTQLDSTLTNSLDLSLRKNLFLAQYQNLDKIQEYEKEAREVLNAKILESVNFKYDSYLNLLSSSERLEIMNTKDNRYAVSKNFSQYMTNREAYLNFYYLYNSNVDRFKQQENSKIEKKMTNDFQKFKESQFEKINSNIIASQKLTDNVISNIEVGEKNQIFNFKPIENIKKQNISDLKFENKKVKSKNFLNKKEKERIIRQIASDHNLSVTFNKKSDFEDYTDKIQYYINEYSYLYIM